MINAMEIFTQELRVNLKAEAENLASLARNMRTVAADLAAGNRNRTQILTLAGFDDPEPMAALLLRVARLRRAAADASDAFRHALIAAAGRVLREDEGE